MHDVLFGTRLSQPFQPGSIQLVGLPLEAKEVQDSATAHVLHSGHRYGRDASVLQHLVLLQLKREHKFFRLPLQARSNLEPRRNPMLHPDGTRNQNQLKHQINK